MFGWSTLKKNIGMTDDSVDCPVVGCQQAVPRQRKSFVAESKFQCPTHRIYISPSTFEYDTEQSNVLWATEDDLALWTCIRAKGVKRESRMARDNSEDAVTWNVFRYLERHGLVGEFVNFVAGEQIARNPRLVYWSYCQASRSPWKPLLDAAMTFGESIAHRSEPDIIVDDETTLMFIENKFGSGNELKGKLEKPKLYQTGGDGWFGKVFDSSADFKSVAVENKLYELMRLWLLGSWAAEQTGKQFMLVNIVRSEDKKEHDIESRFGAHIQVNQRRRFVRATWEQLYSGIVLPRSRDSHDAELLARYYREKTIGYRLGKLIRAFALNAASSHELNPIRPSEQDKVAL